MFDVADQWKTHSIVIDAFVVERLHLRVKHVAEHVRNTSTFERSCLASLINLHIASLDARLEGRREGHRFGQEGLASSTVGAVRQENRAGR